ncbi:MAG: DUF5317 domain-containing protein [Tissierellia bacterium]|nr:DUF5317 domain-containing protein [Tissierellia bacterium]
MIIETVILSFILGKIRGGRIRNIGNLYIKKWYIFVISFLMEIISLLLITRFSGSLSRFLEDNFSYIHIFIYLLLILGLILNFREKGFKLVLFGSLLNFIPILLNNGRMPVSIKALKFSKLYNELTLLEEGRILTHVLIDKSTKLSILSDIIPIPKPYLFPKIISLGDILIAIGLFVLIQTYMKDIEATPYIGKPLN